MAQLITNVTLIDADRVLAGAAIEIRDGLIAHIGARGDFEMRPDAAVLEGQGRWVLPGLIDPHVHLAFDTTPDCLATPLNPEDPQVWATACRNARAALAAGVTTVADCGSPGDLGVRLRAAFASGEELGPRVLVSGPVITVAQGHGAWFGRTAMDPPSMEEVARELLASGADFLKVMTSGGGTPGSVAPWEACYSVPTLRRLVEYAERAGVRVVAHARAAAAIRTCVAAGVHRLEHVTFESGPTAVAFDEDLARRMLASEIWVDPTLPAGRRAMALPATAPARRRQLERTFSQRDPNYRRMAELGLRLLAGTDAGTPAVTFDDFALGPELLTQICGYHPLDAIRSATAWAAESLGLDDQIGRLRPGMQADLILLARDPLTDIRALREIAGVMKGGQWIGGEEVGSAATLDGFAAR